MIMIETKFTLINKFLFLFTVYKYKKKQNLIVQ